MAEEDKYYVGPMNEGQAQAWFQLGGDTFSPRSRASRVVFW